MARRFNVKICGITNADDATLAAEYGADFIGFIFYEKSPRYVSPEIVAEISRQVTGPKKVGVFVNSPSDEVNKIAGLCRLDYVQLHGNESAEYCAQINTPVIKAIHVGPNDDTASISEIIAPYKNGASYLLFDTKSSNLWGGTGKSFDWTLLKRLNTALPFFVSGGLTPQNVKTAVETTSPFGIDVAGGVESSPGIKSRDKLKKFIQSVKGL